MVTIGSKIKEIRKNKGLTQEELAENAKVSLRTIQRIEKGETEPRGKTLVLICEALGIDVKELLNYDKIEDKSVFILMHLSVLAFLAIPVGNILLPFIVWQNKKDKVIDLEEMGENLINFQISWSIITYSILIVGGILIFTCEECQQIFSFFFIAITYLILSLLNIILPIVFSILAAKGKTQYKYPKIIQLV